MTSPRTITRLLSRLQKRRKVNRTDQPHRYAERKTALAMALRLAQEGKQGRGRR